MISIKSEIKSRQKIRNSSKDILPRYVLLKDLSVGQRFALWPLDEESPGSIPGRTNLGKEL